MNSIILKNNTLKLNILEPGKTYNRSRFDWTGIVAQATIGNRTFLTPQAYGDYKDSGGYGLISEFGMVKPLGYWKTLPGKEFMKIGVGALTRKSLKPYSSGNEYNIRPFKTEIKTYNDRVDFIQNNCHVASYGYDYTKSLSIDQNSLSIDYKLKNIGTAVIRTEEYNHNFLKIDNKEISTDTVIECNHPLPIKKIVGPIEVNQSRVSIKEDNNLIYLRSLLKDRPTDFSWKASNGSSTSIECSENFPASMFATWGMRHVISPEVFHSFVIQPGQTLEWSRNYTFNI